MIVTHVVMDEDVLSEIRGTLRTNVGSFNLISEEDSYIIEGDYWTIDLEPTQLGWSVVVKKSTDTGWSEVDLRVGEEYEIPSMIRELIKENF